MERFADLAAVREADPTDIAMMMTRCGLGTWSCWWRR